jgi:hypothetical protein
MSPFIKVATFSPGTLDAGSDNIIMKGAINFGIPQLKYNDNFTLKWLKDNGSVTVVFEEPGTMTLQTKGVAVQVSCHKGHLHVLPIISWNWTERWKMRMLR